MLRRFLNIALAAMWLVPGAGFFQSRAFAAPQDKSKEAQTESKPKPQEAPTAPRNLKEPTGEQVADLVIYASGLTRERIAQIQRSGVERGRVTRTNNEGRIEEVTYERRFMRGETSDKDKVRLDQKMPTLEYSLLYNGGRVWGVVNGSTFTPRQEAVASFITNMQHDIATLLRYKENGAALTYGGKDKQKNIDMWIVDLLDKEKRRTRYYVSSTKWRVLWLEYEETPSGAAKPVQYKRTFHDYRYAQGQLVPYRSVLYADGKQAEEINVLNITFGVKMDEALFQGTEATTAASAQP